MMRNKLLATVAMTALIGCTSFAVAQNAGTQGGAMQSQGAQQHQMGNPGGAMSPPSGGSTQNEPSTSAPQGSNPEGKGFSQEEHNKSATPQRGAQGNGQEQRGAPGSTQEQRGAQNQPGTPQRGAQDNDKANDRAPGNAAPQRGAQDNDRAKDNDRAGANGNQDRMGQQNGAPGRASGGANVQLSQDQRTKIKDVVVGGRNVARADSVNFNIRVGVAVPRTVHVAVLPPEVVTIVPEYRGFEYVVVGDQLLIIDPNTLEIVAILPA
jgi:hypothetical protein